MTDAAALAEMRAKIEEARRVEEEILGVDVADDTADGAGITKKFVAECFRLNERGDGMLFAAVHRNRLVYVTKLSCWLWWAGNHWKIDEEFRYINAVEEVAGYYEVFAADLVTRMEEMRKADKKETVRILQGVIKKVKDRVNKLRSIKGVKTCAEYSHSLGDESISIIGEEIDQKPCLLACPNAVIDLATGEQIESNPDDYLLNAVAAEWKGIDAPCPEWEKFFETIHQGDKGVMRLVHAMLGYSISGLTTEHFIGCFIGEGRNGKGTMFETIKKIIGDLSWSIGSELLLEQRNTRSSAGPSPDLFSLMGRRFVIASETDENQRISCSQVKKLSGGDTIKTRAPFDKKEINFEPTHTLFLYTNHTPAGLARDYALYKRLLFLKYPLKFVDNPVLPDERPRDPDLPQKLREEASGILAWLVRGGLIWRAEKGLHPPANVLADIDAVRLADDVIMQFFNLFMMDAAADNFLTFADIYTKFKEFYLEEIAEGDRYLPSKKRVSKWFVEQGYTSDRRGGTARVGGVAFKPI